MCRKFQPQLKLLWDLFVDKVLTFGFFRIACYRTKMAITREEKPKSTNHSSLGRTYLMREASSQKFFSSSNKVPLSEFRINTKQHIQKTIVVRLYNTILSFIIYYTVNQLVYPTVSYVVEIFNWNVSRIGANSRLVGSKLFNLLPTSDKVRKRTLNFEKKE